MTIIDTNLVGPILGSATAAAVGYLFSSLREAKRRVASDAVSDSRNDQRHLEHERTFKSHASEHKAIRERITELALMHTNEIHELKRSIEIVQKTQGQQGEQLARVETKIELLLDRDSGHGAKR